MILSVDSHEKEQWALSYVDRTAGRVEVLSSFRRTAGKLGRRGGARRWIGAGAVAIVFRVAGRPKTEGGGRVRARGGGRAGRGDWHGIDGSAPHESARDRLRRHDDPAR